MKVLDFFRKIVVLIEVLGFLWSSAFIFCIFEKFLGILASLVIV